jgi:hypothetical protein
VVRGHRIDSELSRSRDQTWELLSVMSAVADAYEFGVKVNAARRHWPAQRKVT